MPPQPCCAGSIAAPNNSTGVWLDRIAAIAGADGHMGLRAHLDAALAQQTGSQPVVIEFVVYDLPDRDCAALASNGELTVANDGINKYKTQFIDPIAAIMKDPKYASLRIVNVVEDDSLPNLVTNLSIATCAEANSSGAYVQGRYDGTCVIGCPTLPTLREISGSSARRRRSASHHYIDRSSLAFALAKAVLQGGCPPKAEATDSNPVGCAIFSMT